MRKLNEEIRCSYGYDSLNEGMIHARQMEKEGWELEDQISENYGDIYNPKRDCWLGLYVKSTSN